MHTLSDPQEPRRCAAVAELLRKTQAAIGSAPISRPALQQIERALRELAAQAPLWHHETFPDPATGQQQRRYLIHEEPDYGLALYLMVMRKGKRTPIHDHKTWACIAAVAGAETNYLYQRIDDEARPGETAVLLQDTKMIEPGQSHAFMPDDIHAVSIENDDIIRHLHLYGRALETLHDREVFHPETRRREPMYIFTPTSMRDAAGRWSIALGDRLIDGHRWSYIDTQIGEQVLIMLPGAQGSRRSFDHQLAALAQRYRVIALSYPGIGDAAGLADGVAAFMAAAGIERAAIFGSSLGGYVAQWLAARQPALIERLLLSNSFVDPTPGRDDPELARLRATPAQAFKSAALRRLEDMAPSIVRDRLLAMVAAQPAESLLQRRIAILTGTPVPRLAIANDRIVIIDADDDAMLPAAMREALVRRYPGAARHRFAAGGHHLHLTRADDVTAIILAA